MDSERVGCVMAARLGCTAVRELFKRGGCSCGAVPMLTKLRRLLGSAHQIAHARAAPKKTLEVVLSNSMSMKAEVDFMHAIKHLEMALATSVAGAMVFTGMCCCLYLSSTKLCR